MAHPNIHMQPGIGLPVEAPTVTQSYTHPDALALLGYGLILRPAAQAEASMSPVEVERPGAFRRAASWLVDRVTNFPQAASNFNRFGTTDLLHWAVSVLPPQVAVPARPILIVMEAVGHHRDAREAGCSHVRALGVVVTCMTTRTPLPVHILADDVVGFRKENIDGDVNR